MGEGGHFIPDEWAEAIQEDLKRQAVVVNAFASDYVPLSRRHSRWRRLGWRVNGWRERVALKLAPWLTPRDEWDD